MNCDEATRVIGRTLDDGLGGKTRDALMVHLERCPECRRESETQLLVSQILASRLPETVPPGFADRLAAALSKESVPAPWWDAVSWRLWSFRLIPIAAAVLWLAFGLHRRTDAPLPADTASALISWSAQDGAAPDPLAEFDQALELLGRFGHPASGK